MSEKKISSTAEAYVKYQFSKIPPKEEERTPYEIRMDSLNDALEECEKVLTGARKAADPRHIPVYEQHKAQILEQIEQLKANPDMHDKV